MSNQLLTHQKLLVLDDLPENGEEVNRLARLKDSGWTLAVFVQGDTEQVAMKLHTAGLRGFFDIVEPYTHVMTGAQLSTLHAEFCNCRTRCFVGTYQKGAMGPAKDSGFFPVEIQSGQHNPLGKKMVETLKDFLQELLDDGEACVTYGAHTAPSHLSEQEKKAS